MDRGSAARETWARPPSVGRLFVEGALYGTVFGGLVGGATPLVDSDPFGIFLGIAFGMFYGVTFGMFFGVCFALGGWAVGWTLVRSRVFKRKGMAIAFGVAVTAIITAAFTATGGSVDPLFVLFSCVMAIAVAIWRGHHHDRVVPK